MKIKAFSPGDEAKPNKANFNVKMGKLFWIQ